MCAVGEPPPDGKVDLKEPLLGINEVSPSGPCMACKCVGMCVEAGESLDQLAQDNLTAAEMMDQAKQSQHCIYLCLRILGWVMFYVGLFLQFAAVPTLFRIIPFIGTWIQAFGNLFAKLAAFFLATFFWCITVAIAWLVMRPVKGIILLLVAIAMVVVPTLLCPSSKA